MLISNVAWVPPDVVDFVDQLAAVVEPRVLSIARRYKKVDTMRKHWDSLLRRACIRVIKALDERDKQVLLQDLRKRQTDMSDKGSAEQIKDVLRNLENERQLHITAALTAAVASGDSDELNEVLKAAGPRVKREG